MIVFGRLYQRMLSWLSSHKSDKYLYGLSFIESIFFPIPPDIMLAPMCATRPDRAMHLALMTTVFSVAGGVLGYFIGLYVFELVSPWLDTSRFWEQYQQASVWMNEWGVWIIIVAAISPIPYKIFTISAGALEQNLALFILASLIGRSARYFLVALLLRHWGPVLLPKVQSKIEVVGWGAVILLIVIIFYYYIRG